MMPKQNIAAVQSTPKPKKKSDNKENKENQESKVSNEATGIDSSKVDGNTMTKEPDSPRKDASTDPIELSGIFKTRTTMKVGSVGLHVLEALSNIETYHKAILFLY